jgi:NADH:quinone reductase (non-electrogenic)
METKKVIIIGGGFGGLTAARNLNSKNFKITLIDKTNYHLFQPLLYQVATAALSPGDIAVPIRAILTRRKNIEVIMAEVTSINKDEKFVQINNEKISFDYLIVAPGSSHSYFGKNEWEKFAPGLKTLSDALSIREKILISFEKAEMISDLKERDKYLTFVIVGGGPTGVEMAGAIAEIARQTMIKDFRHINPKETKVFLVEAAPRVLTAYSEKLSESAKEALKKLGVKVLTGKMVTNIKENSVQLGDEVIETQNIIWAAGNETSPLLKSLNTDLDKAGRVFVERDLSIKNHPDIFVIGDSANIKNKNGELLPGIAPVAIQQAKYVAETINKKLSKDERKPFAYFDKGMMATIGKAKAIAKIRKLEFTGFIAWLLWSFVHIFFLITFRNRVKVMAEWIWYYVTSRRGVRLITRRKEL